MPACRQFLTLEGRREDEREERKGKREGGRKEGKGEGRREREKEIMLYMLLSLTSQGYEVNRGAYIYLNHGLQGFNGLRNAKEFCFFQNTYKTQDTMSFYMTQEDPDLLPRIHLKN